MAAGRQERRVWWVTFLVFTCLGGLWALASPLFSVPDEPQHVVRAVSASRGQILPGERGDEPYLTRVEVPAVYAKASVAPTCYAFRADMPAGCAPPFSGSDRTVTTETSAGTYPPAYYAVVGSPSLVFTSATGVYLMRLLSAAICGALMASAFISVRGLRCSRLLMAGVAVSITPMVLFLAGSVNPNGIEIAAALGLWAALAVAFRQPHAARSTRLLVRVGVAGSVLAVSRPASPLWVVVIVGVLVLWAGYRPALDLLRDRRTWGVVAVVAVACISTLTWVAAVGTLEETPGSPPFGGSFSENVRWALGDTPDQIEQMIGSFGWLDTGPATLTIYLWLFAAGTLVLLALAAAPRREGMALLVSIAGVVLVPVALQVPRASTQGFPWQGRYTLPLAVGVPLLAALIADRSGRPNPLDDQLTRRLAVVLLSLFTAGQLFAHVWATRRYTVGVHGPVNWMTAGGWDPPVPVWALFAGFVVALSATATWLHLLGSGHADRLVLWRTPRQRRREGELAPVIDAGPPVEAPEPEAPTVRPKVAP